MTGWQLCIALYLALLIGCAPSQAEPVRRGYYGQEIPRQRGQQAPQINSGGNVFYAPGEGVGPNQAAERDFYSRYHEFDEAPDTYRYPDSIPDMNRVYR
jgi:hypothetical protein